MKIRKLAFYFPSAIQGMQKGCPKRKAFRVCHNKDTLGQEPIKTCLKWELPLKDILNMKHIIVPIQLLAYLLNAIYILILKHTRLHIIRVVINTDSIQLNIYICISYIYNYILYKTTFPIQYPHMHNVMIIISLRIEVLVYQYNSCAYVLFSESLPLFLKDTMPDTSYKETEKISTRSFLVGFKGVCWYFLT